MWTHTKIDGRVFIKVCSSLLSPNQTQQEYSKVTTNPSHNSSFCLSKSPCNHHGRRTRATNGQKKGRIYAREDNTWRRWGVEDLAARFLLSVAAGLLPSVAAVGSSPRWRRRGSSSPCGGGALIQRRRWNPSAGPARRSTSSERARRSSERGRRRGRGGGGGAVRVGAVGG